MGSKESAIPSPFSYPPPREMCEFGEMDLEVRGREVFWHVRKGGREIGTAGEGVRMKCMMGESELNVELGWNHTHESKWHNGEFSVVEESSEHSICSR